MAINDKGQVFTWGEGIYGQLGHDNLNNEFYPRKVESLIGFKFKSVCGGATHSIAVTTNDNVFGWGSNEKNQLNLTTVKLLPIPLILPIFDNFGSYTIDEIRNLNLDKLFTTGSMTGNIMSKPITSDFITNQMEINTKDLSYNFEDLIKVKLLECGTW